MVKKYKKIKYLILNLLFKPEKVNDEDLIKDGFTHEDIKGLRDKEFRSITNFKYELKQSNHLKNLVREVENQKYGKIFISDFQYTEKRRYDDYDYDYVYTKGKLYLDEDNNWEEIYDDVSYSPTYED